MIFILNLNRRIQNFGENKVFCINGSATYLDAIPASSVDLYVVHNGTRADTMELNAAREMCAAAIERVKFLTRLGNAHVLKLATAVIVIKYTRCDAAELTQSTIVGFPRKALQHQSTKLFCSIKPLVLTRERNGIGLGPIGNDL